MPEPTTEELLQRYDEAETQRLMRAGGPGQAAPPAPGAAPGGAAGGGQPQPPGPPAGQAPQPGAAGGQPPPPEPQTAGGQPAAQPQREVRRILRLPDPTVEAVPQNAATPGERFAAAEAPGLEDQLATIEKLYPGSHPYLEQSGGIILTPEDLKARPELEGRVARGVDRNTGEIKLYLPEQRRIVYTDPQTGKRRQWNPEGLDWGDAAEWVPAVMGGVGYAVGAAKGAATATALGQPELAGPAAVVGGTFGERVAAAAMHLVGKLLGTQDSRTAAEIAKDQVEPILTDLVTGAAGEYTGAAVRQTRAQSIGEGLAGTKRPQEFARPGALEGLERMGTEVAGDPGAALPGGAVLVSRAPSLLQRIDAATGRPSTSNIARRAFDQTEDIVNRYWERTLERTGGAAATRAEAGAGLGPDLMRAKSAADLAVRHTNLKIMERLQAANPDNPDLWLPLPRLREALNDVDAEALGLSHAKGLVAPKEFQNLQRDLESANNGRLPLRTAMNLLTELGDKGGAVALLPGQRAQSLAQHLYGALREDIAAGLDDLDLAGGATAADARAAASGRDMIRVGGQMEPIEGATEPGARALFEQRQADYAAWAKRREQLAYIERARSPEAAFAQAFTGSKQGATLLRELKATVSEDTWNDLVHRKLLEVGTVGQGDRAVFDGLKLAREWDRMAPETRDVLAPAGTELREGMDTLATAGQSWREFERLRNKSHTSGGIEAQRDLALGVLHTLWEPLRAQVVGRLGLTPEARATLAMNPQFVKWLDRGGKIKPGDTTGWALHFERLGTIATAQHLEPQIAAYLRELREQGRPILSGSAEPEQRTEQPPEQGTGSATGAGTAAGTGGAVP